jgi:hypothetical protein
MVINTDNTSADDTRMDTSWATREKTGQKKLVIVEWQDIISDDGWVIAEDCDIPTFYSVGWFEYKDDKVVKIANTLDFDDALEEHKKKEKPIGYAVTCFPTGCVVSITLVSLGSTGSTTSGTG